MYAVIATGGKQYRVAEGDKLKIEKIDAAEGDNVDFDQVLMIGDGENVTVGTPSIAGGVVSAKVLSTGKGKKVRIIKFKRRQNYKRTKGHRQHFVEVEITGINASGGSKKAAPKKTETKKEETKKEEAKQAAPKAEKKKEAEAEVLARIQSRSEAIDFARIGSAQESDKDDLKVIKGVGPFCEAKLNALGIYTYEQVANFTDEDADKVNDAIEFFSGRIKRDEWAKQAQALAANK